MQFARYLVVALAVAFAAPHASAQQNSVIEHYRAYVAALERGDEQAAAHAAQAAYDASYARDGDGGRTGVLALNLAIVRLLAGEPEPARAAAQRALELAHTGAAGVNPALAELIVARADLAIASGPDAIVAARRLAGLLQAPSAATLPAGDAYIAGEQLGDWGFANENWELAQSGWGAAGAHATGAARGENYGFGRARTREAIAMLLPELTRRSPGALNRNTARAAHALLIDALQALQPISQIESPTLELSYAQLAYAEANAWIGALEAKVDADGRPLPARPVEVQGDADGLSEIGPVDLTRPRCMFRSVAPRLPSYPEEDQVATVVLFIRVNERGEIVAHQVAARAGAVEFAEAIEDVIDDWRLERMDTSAPNCRMESSFLQTVRFVLSNDLY